MSLSIRIICSPDGESISEWTKLFPANGGEIGRAYGSTMQLSDSTRTISSTHAIIRKSSRGYQILDNSTNGLFINGSDKPLGKGKQTAINDGDVLSIGKYRLLVSCFLPALAKAKPDEEVTLNSTLGNDPFVTSEAEDVNLEPQVEQETQFDFSNNEYEVVEEDPFLIDSEKTTQESKPFVTSFAEVDEDPLKDTSLDFDLSSFTEDKIEPSFNEPISNENSANAEINDDLFAAEKIEPSVSSEAKYSLAQYKSAEERMSQYTEQALDYAINKILNDMSPENIEGMFTDLVPNSFWSRKPDFWSMYKRYFERQMKNKDWEIKFQAYFQEGIRLQRNLEENR